MLEIDSVYRKHAEFVYKYLFSLCHEEDTVEELLQETFYQAIKSAKRYDGSCKVTTWLCQIAKHLWYQELERRRKYQSSTLHENTISEEKAVEEKLCQREQLIEIFQRVHILGLVYEETKFKDTEYIDFEKDDFIQIDFGREKRTVRLIDIYEGNIESLK